MRLAQIAARKGGDAAAAAAAGAGELPEAAAELDALAAKTQERVTECARGPAAPCPLEPCPSLASPPLPSCVRVCRLDYKGKYEPAIKALSGLRDSCLTPCAHLGGP